jgi:hypothetical protein
MSRTANPVWFIYSRKSFSIESIPICNYMFLNRIMTFHSNSFCWAGSSNVRQKHIFPNGIIKVQLENYNSFRNYKLFPGLKTYQKKKNTILRYYLLLKKNCQHMVIIVYIKGREMHHWSHFSQPNIGKSNFEHLKCYNVTDSNHKWKVSLELVNLYKWYIENNLHSLNMSSYFI